MPNHLNVAAGEQIVQGAGGGSFDGGAFSDEVVQSFSSTNSEVISQGVVGLGTRAAVIASASKRDLRKN